MTCGCGSRRDNINTKFSPIYPHFFKIILEETLRDNKLQIPKRFVVKCGGSLSSQAFLKLPCGLRWKVGLTKRDGKVWIDKGWKKFAEYYSLGHGDLLVFRYEGDSQFHVIILDTSTMEIDYPSNPNHFEKHDIGKQSNEFVEKETEDDVSIEILDSFSTCPKTRDKSPLPYSRPCKKMKTSPFGKTQSDLSHLRSKGGNKCMPLRSMKPEEFTMKQGLNPKQNTEALKKASGFRSKDPFFLVSMQPSFIGANSAMLLPSFFARKYLCTEDEDVILKVQDGRTWSVKYSFRLYNGSLKARFNCGWEAFAQDNDLKVSDVCVFVLTNTVGILFEVHIFCENGVANSTALPEFEVMGKGSLSSKVESGHTMNKVTGMSTPPRSQKPSTIYRKTSALERASCFQSENPFFTVAMKASYTTGQNFFCLTYKFAETYINMKECEASLWVSDGKSWSVLLKVRLRGRSPVAEFCRGWKEFVLDNSLKAGDICTFELTDGHKFSFRVSIAKVADDAYNHLDTSRKMRSEENTGGQVTQRPSSSGFRRASEAASHFFSTNPYFQVAMGPDRVVHSRLHVPRTFAKRYFEENAQTVTLWVGKRSWHVKLLAYPSQYKFSAGWAAFARENSLQPRDVCIFELIKRNQLELKVSIFRESDVA